MERVERDLEEVSRILRDEINDMTLQEYKFHPKIIQNLEFPDNFSSKKIIRTEFKQDGNPIGLVIQPPLDIIERTKNEDIRVCKKSFENIMTDIVNRDLVFEISDNLHISKFQLLINQLFNTQIKKYIRENGGNVDDNKTPSKKKKEKGGEISSWEQLTTSDIVFIYKGGSVMQMIYGKNRDFFKNSGLDDFICQIRDKFKRSDSDYSILINPNIVEELWLTIYRDMNVLTHNLLMTVRKYLLDNNFSILPLGKLDEERYLFRIIEEISKNIKKISANNNCANEYNRIDQVLGLRYFNGNENKDYFYKNSEEIKNQFDSLHNEENFDLYFEKSNRKKRNFIASNQKEIPLSKSDVYITYQNNIAPEPPIVITSDPYEDSPISYSYNEALEFGKSKFTLQRLKLNFGIYYLKKEELGLNNEGLKLGYMIIPSELVDVTIPKREDAGLNNVYNHFDFEIKKYKSLKDYQDKRLEYEFNSYTIYGFITDLILSIFGGDNLPWVGNPKFLKRVRRLLFFIFIELTSLLYSKEKSLELLKRIHLNFSVFENNIISGNEELNLDINNTFINNLNAIVADLQVKNNALPERLIPSLTGNFITKIIELYRDRIFVLRPGDERKKHLNQFYKMINESKELINLLITFLSQNNTTSIGESYVISDKPEIINSKYYNKYLKYKNKYLVLKSKILTK